MSVARVLPFRVLVITAVDACRVQRRGVVETVARAFLPDARGVALLVRMKSSDVDDVRSACIALRAITQRAGALLLVHTHAALVGELALDGVHVAARADAAAVRSVLPEGALLGASRHAGDALDDAALSPLDYVTLSPVFAPASKPHDTRPPLGLDGLRTTATTVARPLVALGGIDDTRAASCLRAGASAVGVIGAVMTAHAPRRSLAALLDATLAPRANG